MVIHELIPRNWEKIIGFAETILESGGSEILVEPFALYVTNPRQTSH